MRYFLQTYFNSLVDFQYSFDFELIWEEIFRSNDNNTTDCLRVKNILNFTKLSFITLKIKK